MNRKNRGEPFFFVMNKIPSEAIFFATKKSHSDIF